MGYRKALPRQRVSGRRPSPGVLAILRRRSRPRWQPFLIVTAASTGTHVGAAYGALRSWVPHAENVELPGATHCMLQSNPKGAAELLANFFARHPPRV
jgi:pimeloyl-ACP methyl ester carboxylesterase